MNSQCNAYSVLVVDDDEEDFILLTARSNQKPASFVVSYASDGHKAMAELQTGLRPSLILVDAYMTLMDGHELLSWLKNTETWRHIPVVIWTGTMSEGEVIRYKQAGAHSIIFKEEVLGNVAVFYDQWLKVISVAMI